MTIENKLALALNEAYNNMRSAGGTKEFTFTINAHVSGYGNEGLIVKYNIGGYGDTDKTEGSTINAVVKEYMRRKNWTEKNKPMILIGSGSIDADPQPEMA